MFVSLKRKGTKSLLFYIICYRKLTENNERNSIEAGAQVGETPEQYAELQRVHEILNQEQPETPKHRAFISPHGCNYMCKRMYFCVHAYGSMETHVYFR